MPRERARTAPGKGQGTNARRKRGGEVGALGVKKKKSKFAATEDARPAPS